MHCFCEFLNQHSIREQRIFRIKKKQNKMEKNSLSDAKIASKTTYWVYQMDNPWHYQVHTNKFCSTAIKSTHQLGNSLEHLAIRNNIQKRWSLPPIKSKSTIFAIYSYTSNSSENETHFSERNIYLDLENDNYLDVDKI